MISHTLYRWLVSFIWAYSVVLAAQAQTNQAQNLFNPKLISHVVTTPHVRAELMAYAPDGALAGKPLELGLQIQHQPGWHTYWKNPGDSGLPTQLTWTLPAGTTAGAIAWPAPKKITVAQLANYGYEGTVLLSVPVTVDAAFQSPDGQLTINLKAQWLVCKTECIPEEGEFVLKIPVSGSTVLKRSIFLEAQAREPKTHSGAITFLPSEKSLKLIVSNLPAGWQGKQLDAFPEVGEIIETAAKQEQSWTNGQWTANIPLNSQRSQSPTSMAWVIKISGELNNPSLRVEAKLDGVWPSAPAAKPAALSPALEAALEKNKAIQNTNATNAGWMSGAFWLAIVGALVGGLILNFMPCVLPVLAIKIFSFAPKKVFDSNASVAKVLIEPTGAASVHLDETLSFHRSSALFALGVVGTFALLGGLLMLLRAAGEGLGWGFQLQSPTVVAALALLFMLIGLNLFEVFQLRLVLPAKLVGFQSHNPSLEALASGALAVLIATPCTAPFMGASLGLAIHLPAMQAILIFIALGLGMALPFILIAIIPSLGAWLLKVLPKPGNWMAVMRHFLAWPMFATTLWLIWIYAQQTHMDMAFALLFVFLMITALIWALGLAKGRPRTVVTALFALCLVASCYLWVSAHGLSARQTTASTSASSAWTDWSSEAQASARASGRPVFIDFTASWCITCQINKSTTLNQADIEAALKAKNVLLLRADWTKTNPAISTELAKLGRTGLPVYALYLPGASAPRILPEVLTKAILLEALSVL